MEKKNPNFGPDFSLFVPNVGPKYVFVGFTSLSSKLSSYAI